MLGQILVLATSTVARVRKEDSDHAPTHYLQTAAKIAKDLTRIRSNAMLVPAQVSTFENIKSRKYLLMEFSRIFVE